jgi:hypothetical protein
VLSWVNETDMEELELQFSSFLGARQSVFGPFGLIYIFEPLGVGHAFPRQRHMRKGGGGGGLFISFGVFYLYYANHGCIT